MFTNTGWRDLLYPGKATDFFARQTFLPFDPSITDYNHVNARWLAELSRLVYRHDIEEDNSPPQPTRASFLEKAGFKRLGFFISKETDTQAMLVESLTTPKFAVLVFRGTEQNSGDLKTDIKIWKNFYSALETVVKPLNQNGIDVHAGMNYPAPRARGIKTV